ncbi:hypothetical protein C4D60_Mb03t21060 [Musa balbisiana]|uniref:Uncharacterized protein n=1 Tax=Musa balbisiana TaxID=52838 RepID=A0A4S8JBS7_MUSBA|nr:hypothetical protein C4D60_Mb03t21060 [Musa balbisiana]
MMLMNMRKQKLRAHLEKTRPQSQEWPRVPQALEHLAHTHCRWLLCLRRKCFLIPTRSPRAWHGSWCRHVGSGHTNTRFRTSAASRRSSFHGTLCRRRCICRFWSLWNPWLQISHTYRSDSSSVLGDSDTTSASGSSDHHRNQRHNREDMASNRVSWVSYCEGGVPVIGVGIVL